MPQELRKFRREFKMEAVRLVMGSGHWTAWLLPSFLGALTFATVQGLLFLEWHPPPQWQGENMAWYLNSGRSALLILASLTLIALICGLFRKGAALQWGTAILVGATVAMSFMLSWIDPGNIFPVVLVIGASLNAFAIMIGIAIGLGARAFISALR